MEAGKIAGLFATFVVCAVLGYLIPLQNFVGSSNESEEAEAESVIEIGKKKKAKGDNDGDWLLGEVVEQEEEAASEAAEEENTEANDVESAPRKAAKANAESRKVQDTPKQMESEPEPETPKAEPKQAAQSDASNVPSITQAYVQPRNSKNHTRVGFSFVAKATVASGDALKYELYEIGGSEPKYNSDNGSFYNVLPVDGGKYKLVVKNSRTGDEATQEVSGFTKINKLSASQLQAQLNADVPDKLIYHYFDIKKLRFDCTGVDASEAPTTLDAFFASRAAYGWTVQVVGTPKYDNYNRITYFKINLN